MGAGRAAMRHHFLLQVGPMHCWPPMATKFYQHIHHSLRINFHSFHKVQFEVERHEFALKILRGRIFFPLIHCHLTELSHETKGYKAQ